jgi:hypothetical protein
VSERIDRAIAKSILAAEGAAIGGTIGGPVGATIGAVGGLIVGDQTTVFPIDMIAIPAYQAHLLQGTPAMTVYIKAGETLQPTGGNVDDYFEGVAEATEMAPVAKPRKASPYNRRYAKAFKSVQGRYKKKDGSWKKNGFKNAQREAHKMAKAGGNK